MRNPPEWPTHYSTGFKSEASFIAILTCLPEANLQIADRVFGGWDAGQSEKGPLCNLKSATDNRTLHPLLEPLMYTPSGSGCFKKNQDFFRLNRMAPRAGETADNTVR